MPLVSVHKYLESPAQYSVKGVCIIFGKDSFLKQQAENQLREKLLSGEDGEFSLTQFEGNKDLKFIDVFSAAASKSMFGGSSRVVLISDADAFVSANRSLLEDYAVKPSSNSIVIIMLTECPSNTKLHKIAADSGLIIEANTLSEKEMPNWIIKRAKQHYKIICDKSAAELMVQMVGAVHGLLDGELEKLSVLVKDKGKITPELVEQNSGLWSTKGIFEILDAALAGKTAEAMSQLNKLLNAGEQPIALLAAISGSLRRFAAATQLILESEKNRKSITVRTALERAGVAPYFLAKSESQLKMLGRIRGAELPIWLLQADLALKGESRTDKRFVIEMLLVRISDPRLRGR